MKRSFLFLQGVCSPFFSRMGARLRALGHEVVKVNFTVGDAVYWQAGGALAYRSGMEALPAFYADLYASRGITDVMLFGDCRPVHRPAVMQARSQGVRVHVFDEGYFRPYWVTMEQGGVNAHSSLPRDPQWYREAARKVPSYGNGQPFASPFWRRAAYDVGYNFWAGLTPLLYPGYRSHVPHNPLAEYLSYARRGWRVQRRGPADARTIAKVVAASGRQPFFLFPLQLGTDAQIRWHSPFEDMRHALGHVMRSFARHAPARTALVIKNHPLDPGFVDYQVQTRRLAAEYGLQGRVHYLESGHLPTLLSHAAGVVTVNSTVGGSSLIHGCPTIALAPAIYALPGLTFQRGLDRFWTEHCPPDEALFHAFRNVVIHATQINGGFYCRRGIDMAVENALPRLSQPWARLDPVLGALERQAALASA
ncbi:capsule biosynthesis protein [Bordetella pseudohinzii]|uniref:Capsule biosynthesis protein CapA n=2 Tax=Bordetella pseudohinzii TaxID=1331258 RepID=A0ABM6DC81_9BORD|nr:capsular biosynthesis protein [Bordetella pseudohinzii]ANY15052.1 capsule biosynthesis protein CapA [Bordetella pseudohinzii]KMM26090.1 capsule biosynthesis protein CapA [Bordetella pseudohinzii]KXA79833.1 capsule biosynthesis protein CapA [Bordetella pseudohinzii]KXA82824.1 capsule biosynthesis protein CapA [Bordetella pseudohinzii]